MTKMDQDRLTVAVEKAIAARNYGRATAAKRGRHPKFPYVPLIHYGDTRGPMKTENPYKGAAFATREEAAAKAQTIIDARIAHDRKALAAPGRTGELQRRYWKLPREFWPTLPETGV